MMRSSFFSYLRNYFVLIVLLAASMDAAEFTARQQLLINRMKESVESKISSKTYGDEFVNLLKKEKLSNTGILRVMVGPDGLSSVQAAYGEIAPCRQFVESLIKQYLSHAPEADFFIVTGDGVALSKKADRFMRDHIVLLGCDNRKDDERFVLIPDLYISGQEFGDKITKIASCDRISRMKGRSNNFFKKIPKGKFIGSQTGGIYSIEKIDEIPRLKAKHLAKAYPDFLQIDFIDYGCQAKNQEFIDYMYLTFGPPAMPEPQSSLSRYRYLLCFDGNCSAWERPEIIMHSGSVPLFQTNYEKYWTLLLEDGVNYIKLEDDLSNLVDTIKFLNANEAYAQSVAEAAKSIAEDVLTPGFIKKYYEELILTVHLLQQKAE